MITNKTFVVAHAGIISAIIYLVEGGLLQGTVCAPTLFDIFNDGFNLYNINLETKKEPIYSIAFADDLITLVAGKNIKSMQSKLQKTVDNINSHYQTWNLKINPSKCETIVFRKPINNLSSNTKDGLKDFQISAVVPGTNQRKEIPRKKIVKYLGIHLDYLLRMNQNTDLSLEKAKKAYNANYKLFNSKYLSKKAKVICYQLLIRPIMVYGAPIWWNISASSMEKLRKFERKCLRACLNKYRTPDSNFQHHYSNKVILNEASIPRIDCFILKLTRDYFARCKSSKNKIIRKFTEEMKEKSERQAFNGYMAPEAFTTMDQMGLIQDGDNIPIIYHIKRNRADKRIRYKATSCKDRNYIFRYNKTLSVVDHRDFSRLSPKYWWRAGNDNQLQDIKSRKEERIRSVRTR